jgi:aspartyl-tRNA(Asn)/glutamyl-tRNA(Gln) amidotransferase subunit C
MADVREEKVDAQEVLRVAKLARVHVGLEEAQVLAHDLGRILGYVRQLESVDVAEVEATTHVSVEGHVRPDAVVPSMPVEKALANAPERLGDGFGVPKIIE